MEDGITDILDDMLDPAAAAASSSSVLEGSPRKRQRCIEAVEKGGGRRDAGPDEELSCDTWKHRMLRSLEESGATQQEQKRRINIVSLCSGMATERYGLKVGPLYLFSEKARTSSSDSSGTTAEAPKNTYPSFTVPKPTETHQLSGLISLQRNICQHGERAWPQEVAVFDFHLEAVCDKKISSQQFLQATLDPETHLFSAIDDLCGPDEKAKCLAHKGHCKTPQAVDMVIAGFPCAPYSFQRVGRKSSRHGLGTRPQQLEAGFTENVGNGWAKYIQNFLPAGCDILAHSQKTLSGISAGVLSLDDSARGKLMVRPQHFGRYCAEFARLVPDAEFLKTYADFSTVAGTNSARCRHCAKNCARPGILQAMCTIT